MENNNIEIVIDWFQITIFPSTKDYDLSSLGSSVPTNDRVIVYLFNFLFNIPFNMITKERGVNGYDIRYMYNDISIMNNSQREDMGVNILLTGKGCRDFESLGIKWEELFNKIKNFDLNFNRIDIAIDCFDNKYFDLELLKKYIKKGCCCSKFQKSLLMYELKLKNGSISSNTIQFGSKASDIQITFYDKLLERKNAGYIIEKNIKFWIRTELRFRHERAEEIFHYLTSNEDYSKFIFSILYQYIDFKVLDSTDSNLSRRDTAKFWLSFIQDNIKIRLVSHSRESDIIRKYNWLLESTSKSQFMVYISKMPNIKTDYISNELMYQILISGIENIKDKDIQLINDYRIKNKLVPVTKKELLDYIEDIRNTILE